MSLLRLAQPSAALRALAVKETVAKADGPVVLSEIMSATGLPKPTVHRILVLLECAGMLVRQPQDKRYGAGPRLSALALDVVSGRRLAHAAPRHPPGAGERDRRDLQLALMPSRTRRRIVDTLPLQSFTANTITDRKALMTALERIRTDRCSTDNEEYMAGTVCAAVPLANDERSVPAVLAVMPRSRA